MRILGLDFSSDRRSAAALEAGAGVPPTLKAEAAESGDRNMQALTLVDTVLRQAGWERHEVECIALGLGPGSYAGIRSSIALAQGWQLARGVRLLGLSSVECLAAQARAEGLWGPIAVVIDAQRGEFYLARYEVRPENWSLLEPLRLAAREAVQERLAAGDVVLGPEVKGSFAGGRLMFPNAGTVARLAVGREDFVPGEMLEPIYLRPANFVKAPPPRFVG
jgi:tRNA threonylcarbamoyl adenosine modification protein YeaZ